MLEHVRGSVNDRIAQLRLKPQMCLNTAQDTGYLFVGCLCGSVNDRIVHAQLKGAFGSHFGEQGASRGRQGYNPGDPQKASRRRHASFENNAQK